MNVTREILNEHKLYLIPVIQYETMNLSIISKAYAMGVKIVLSDKMNKSVQFSAIANRTRNLSFAELVRFPMTRLVHRIHAMPS